MEDGSSPNLNLMDCGLIEGFPVDNQQQQANSFCDVSTNLNKTFNVTPVNGSVNFWNENLSLISNCEVESEEYETFTDNTENGSNSLIMSPDIAGSESQLGSCETSRRGSTENDGSSLSSGEMVLRTNSFCLEDQSLLLVSSLEDSSIIQSMDQPVLPSDSNMLSITLDFSEKYTEKITEEDTGHPGLHMTFNQAELPIMENYLASDSFVALPSENGGGPLTTFICETSPEDLRKEAKGEGAEAELLSVQAKAFVLSVSPVLCTGGKQTSTPVQSIENDAHCFLSPVESPCIGNSCSSGVLPDPQQHVSVTPKESLFTASKFKRMGIRKFPKSDFSNVKSKVVTRNVHQMSASGPASKQRLSQVMNTKHTEAHRGATFQASPPKKGSGSAVLSSTSKTVNDAKKLSLSSGKKVMESSLHTAVDGQTKSVGSPSCPLPSAVAQASGVQCREACSVTQHAASSQVADTIAQSAGNQTFCFSSLEKSLDGSHQTDPNQTPKKDSSKIEVGSGSALGHDKLLVTKTQPHCSSASSSSSARPVKEKRTTFSHSTNFTFAKVDTRLGQRKPGNSNCSSQNKKATSAETTHGLNENSRRAVKINLVDESGASAELDESKSRFQRRPSLRQTKVSPRSQPSAASPYSSTRQRQTTLGRDECRTSTTARTPQSNQRSITGNQRAQATGGPTLGTTLAATNKPQLNGSRPPQTPARPSHISNTPTPASRLRHKPLGPFRSQTEANAQGSSEGADLTQASGGATQKQTPFRTALLKSRFTTAPVKNTGLALTPTCKSAASISKGASNSTVSQLKKALSARLTSAGPVDKNKPRASSHQQRPQPQPSTPTQSHERLDVVPASVTEEAKKDEVIQQLRGLLATSNCRFEAVAIVLQQILAQRDEATRHCRELSQELVNLRGELVSSIHSSELLEKEKDELRVALEDSLQKLQEQHRKDLVELEQRLQAFYQSEWDKVQVTYQEEADKCKALMQQQIKDLKANNEAVKLMLENSHTEQLASVKQQCEMSLEELRKVHKEELQSLDKALKDSEATLNGQIEELTVENNALIEKLSVEEGRRKALAENSQKDSHTLYLEQELESLKVVLDIKNKQLHQQEKQLMEIEKLKEKNLKLDESFRKVQQENEDFKARMDRHAALSRQLSTEQAVLQESLQKESKVNKRLSMENEELLWKLHNGDLSSPRKMSPTSTSPSHSFSLHSPRSSGLFSSPPVSPR